MSVFFAASASRKAFAIAFASQDVRMNFDPPCSANDKVSARVTESSAVHKRIGTSEIGYIHHTGKRRERLAVSGQAGNYQGESRRSTSGGRALRPRQISTHGLSS